MACSFRTTGAHAALVTAILLGTAACSREQRSAIDSAVDSGAVAVRAALSVIDIDMGRHVGPEKKVTDATDEFAPADTIYASIHTSGTATSSPITARWTFQDGTVVDETTQNVTTSGDAYTVFFITKPDGFPKGKYTVHVLVDGREVRSKDVTVM